MQQEASEAPPYFDSISRREIGHGRFGVRGTDGRRQLEGSLQHAGLADEVLAAAARLLPWAATASLLGQPAEGANASTPILFSTFVEATAVASDATNPLDCSVAAVVAVVMNEAAGPRPSPDHRCTVERVVIGRTRKVIEAELEVTSGPLLGSLTIGPFTSCPAGRSPIDRGRSLHRTGRGRIGETLSVTGEVV